MKKKAAKRETEMRPLRAGPMEIKLSDPVPLDKDFWMRAMDPLYLPTKTSTTVRIDSDVLQWLRSHGRGWQSRINAILRREMLAALNSHLSQKDGSKGN